MQKHPRESHHRCNHKTIYHVRGSCGLHLQVMPKFCHRCGRRGPIGSGHGRLCRKSLWPCSLASPKRGQRQPKGQKDRTNSFALGHLLRECGRGGDAADVGRNLDSRQRFYKPTTVLLPHHELNWAVSYDLECLNFYPIRSYLNFSKSGGEVCVWGNNQNHSLGIGNVQGREVPQYLETFQLARIRIEQVSLNSHHSLFLSTNGGVYAIGDGSGGRLGTGYELSLVTPRKISIPTREAGEKIICVSAGRNHSLVLSNKNRAYATGSNTFFQLGFKTKENIVLTFEEVPKTFWWVSWKLSWNKRFSFRGAIKVIASEYTSFVVTATDVYAFGSNLGQMGPNVFDKIITPRKVSRLLYGLRFVWSLIQVYNLSNYLLKIKILNKVSD